MRHNKTVTFLIQRANLLLLEHHCGWRIVKNTSEHIPGIRALLDGETKSEAIIINATVTNRELACWLNGFIFGLQGGNLERL